MTDTNNSGVPANNVEATIAQLHSELIQSAQTFKTDPRQGVIQTFDAFYKVAQANGLAENGELVPLMQVKSQFVDLERGIVGSLIKRHSVAGRPGKSSSLQGIQVIFVYCVDLLVEAGDEIEVACRRVSGEARIQGFHFPGVSDTKTLKEWRYEKLKWRADSQMFKTYHGLKEAQGDLKPIAIDDVWPILKVIVGNAVARFVLVEDSTDELKVD